jgi:hypothetical protein
MDYQKLSLSEEVSKPSDQMNIYKLRLAGKVTLNLTTFRVLDIKNR